MAPGVGRSVRASHADCFANVKGLMQRFQISLAHHQQTLAAVLRYHRHQSWQTVKDLCVRGKVTVAGHLVVDFSVRVKAGDWIEVNEQAPRPLSSQQRQAEKMIVHEDAHVVVINKPAGLMSVPYERGDTDTAMDWIRMAWRLQGKRATSVPLHIVHRIDKDTSGLLVFAKTKTAERDLQAQLRAHTMERTYLCLVHGHTRDARIVSDLVSDRGDGLRGSRAPHQKNIPAKQAITWVHVLKTYPEATLCEVRLETGRTHQIRIHLAEQGHPLVGETVYVRDYLRQGHQCLESPRLMLHAQTLGFLHPVSHQTIRFQQDPPVDFMEVLKKL